MTSERLMLTVLPVTIDPARPYHVSLHIAPRLSPSGATARLGEFASFSNWPKALTAVAKLALRDETGHEIAATPLLKPADPALWNAVFPSNTPVGARKHKSFTGRRWRTFAARHVHDVAVLHNFGAMLHSSTETVRPSASPLRTLVYQGLSKALGLDAGHSDAVDELEKLIAREGRGDVGEPQNLRKAGRATRQAAPDPLPDLGWLDTRVTKHFDEHAETIARSGPASDRPEDVAHHTLAHLHLARRFYERVEAQSRYQERPTHKSPQMARPKPDFHEQVAHLADHHELLRKLGLVIDVHVRDLARLGNAKELSAYLEIRGAQITVDSLRTPVARVGSALTVAAKTRDWHNGRLRLGDRELFSVLVHDTDGSALKHERFSMTLPRLHAVEKNGDPAHAAPPTLRSDGFTIARTNHATSLQHHLDETNQLEASSTAAGGTMPLISAEQVTRGFRVEVWDDTDKRWFNLHDRLITLDVENYGQAIKGVLSRGYSHTSSVSETPGVINGDVHAHDALFGWSGWSLSAARPGQRVRHEGGKEIIEDQHIADPQSISKVKASSRVAPGTLPRLRYGRHYAFRASAVDLAGNSLDWSPTPSAPIDGASGVALAAPVLQLQAMTTLDITAAANAQTVHPLPIQRIANGVLGAIGTVAKRPATAASQSVAAGGDPARGPEAGPAPAQSWGAATAVSPPKITGNVDVDRMVVAHLAPRVVAAVSQITRAQLAHNVLRSHLDVGTHDLHFKLPAQSLAAMARASAAVGGLTAAQHISDMAATATPLVPHLRWDPVLQPTVVARRKFTMTESIRHLVIRSGVTMSGPADTGGTIALVPPKDFAGLVAELAQGKSGIDLDYPATSERHLVPPKSSQAVAEQHGLFDEAMGSKDTNVRRRALAIALRDDGTLLDPTVSDLADPNKSAAQPGIRLEAGPEVPASTLKTLATLQRGDPLTPGQYVVHDTDQLALPYLPDPLARGLTMIFPDAEHDAVLAPPFALEGLTLRFKGDWPSLEPYRLVLANGPNLAGKVDGNVITITLPPGQKLRLRLASCLNANDLALMGFWNMLPEAIRTNPLVSGPAADGWIWALSPSEEIELVHAVPRPIMAPRVTVLVPLRAASETHVSLIGGISCHGDSTDHIEALARWSEQIDDVSQAAPSVQDLQGIAFSVQVKAGQELVVLAGDLRNASNEPVAEDVVPMAGLGKVRRQAAVHTLPDTKHRVIDYAMRATTRFREYFDPILFDTRDGTGITGKTVKISVPSSARPPAPVINSIVPLFRWESSTQPQQPFGHRNRRRTGLRLYLERPWFRTGEGEMLAVVLATSNDEREDPVVPFTSQWGADPMWHQHGPERRAIGFELMDFLRVFGVDDRPEAAKPVSPPATLPLVDVANGKHSVGILSYRPEFDPVRRLWFVDIAINPDKAVWPFVRLAVARYQPQSLPGLHLSPVVICDFAQLTPERTATLTRPDAQTVRVLLSGHVGWQQNGHLKDANQVRANRRILATLEQRVPEVDSDLAWKTIESTELAVAWIDRGEHDSRAEVTWFGGFHLQGPVPLARPGGNLDWRVTVVEMEGIPADPVPLTLDGPTRLEWRVVYADHLSL
jgi:hypothetical protein